MQVASGVASCLLTTKIILKVEICHNYHWLYMLINLLVWHCEPEYPSGQLQITRVRPNRTKVTHLPPLRHGQSTKPGVGEAVTAVVVVGVVEVGVGKSHISALGLSLVTLVSVKLLPLES